MKRKILSILLIIFMLSASLITIPVNAKILNEADHSWWESDDTFIDGGVTEDTVYDSLSEYANIHSSTGVMEPSYTTRLVLSGSNGNGASLAIKDLSDIYTYPNLTELVLWNIGDKITQAALDALDFSRLPNLEKLYIKGVNIANLEIGQLENLTYLRITDSFVHSSLEELYINIDLSDMDNLTYYSYHISSLPEGVFEDDIDKIASYITAPLGCEVYYQSAGDEERDFIC